MTSPPLLLRETRGSTAWLALNRPEAMNALSPDLLDALEVALVELTADTAVRALVITGAGRAFCAGADLAFALDSLSGGGSGDALLSFVERAGAVLDRGG